MTDNTAPARPKLSRDKVLAEAIALADAEGLEKLSMRRLADRLGVEAMSLYNHVKGKDDLLGGMVDRVAGKIARPDPKGDWRAEMETRARSMHRVLTAHPWAPLVILGRVTDGPGMLGLVDATLGTLMGAGFSPAEADHAWNAIDNHVYGFTLQELRFPFRPEDYAAAAAEYLPMIPEERFPHLRRLTEEVAARRHDGVQDFDYGLALILDGLERRLRAG